MIVNVTSSKQVSNGKWVINFEVNGEKQAIWEGKFNPRDQLSEVKTGDRIEVEQKGKYFNFKGKVTDGPDNTTKKPVCLSREDITKHLEGKVGSFVFAYIKAEELFDKKGIIVPDDTKRAAAIAAVQSLDKRLYG